MPSTLSRPRHAAPRDPGRRRAALLPGTLLLAAGAAFGGLAVLPASAQPPTGVSAAAALAPVELAPPAALAADVNASLNAALSRSLVAATRPSPKPAASPSTAPSPRPSAARASRGRSDSLAPRGGAYVRPGIGRLTSGYGRRWGRLHAGIDLASGIGSPVRAVAAGTVVSAGTESGYGRCVRIEHADGVVTVYAHQSQLLVSAGERVAAGEQIGREGNTGHSTGPHLHFEVRINGTPINPIPWLRRHGISV